MPQRPPLADRWEFQLVSGLLGMVLLALQISSRRAGDRTAAAPPALQQWLAARRSEQVELPWRAQLATERAALRTLTALWLAWRAHRYEKAATPGR